MSFNVILYVPKCKTLRQEKSRSAAVPRSTEGG